MEEQLLSHPILTLTLNSRFHPQQWNQLTQQPPTHYQRDMRTIYAYLTEHQLHPQLQHFARNQRALELWHRNTPPSQPPITPYLFRPNHPQHSPSAVRSYFAQWVGGHDCQHIDLPPAPIDNHELYLRTFSACRGERYAPYDYERHMRSSQERTRYNQYIRINHKRQLTNPAHTPPHRNNPLGRFCEWRNTPKQSSSLADFRQVLGNLTLNSQRGLQGLMQRQGTRKLVLLNHQRKPVNYYLRPSKVRNKEDSLF